MSSEEITTVTISSTIMDAPFACNTLSPYTGQEVYNFTNAESGIFAKALFNYDDCYSAIGGENDLCEQNININNFKSVSSFTSTSSYCMNLGLSNVDLCYDYPTTNGYTHSTLGNSFPGTLDYVTQSESWLRLINSNLLVSGDTNNLIEIDGFPIPDGNLQMNSITSDGNHTVYMVFEEIDNKMKLLMYNVYSGIRHDIYTTDMTDSSPFDFLGYEIDIEGDIAYVYIGQQDGPNTYNRTVLRINDISNSTRGVTTIAGNLPSNSDIVTSYTIQCKNTDIDSYHTLPTRPISISSGSNINEEKIYIACGWVDFEYFEIAEYDVATNSEIDYSIKVTGIEADSSSGPPTDIEVIDQILVFPQESSFHQNNTIFLRGSISGDMPSDPSDYFVVRVDLYYFQYPEVYVAPTGPPPPARKLMRNIGTGTSTGRKLLAPPPPGDNPTPAPTVATSPAPTVVGQTNAPTAPTVHPTKSPTPAPSENPTNLPTSMPTYLVDVSTGYMKVVADIPYTFNGNNYMNRIPNNFETVFIHDASNNGLGTPGGANIYLNLSFGSYNYITNTPTTIYRTSEAIIGMQYSTCNGNTTSNEYGFMSYVAYSEFRQTYCKEING